MRKGENILPKAQSPSTRAVLLCFEYQATRRFRSRYWTSIRSWGLIIVGVLWLTPLLILNICYGPPWYMDLWDALDNLTHRVRLPAHDRNLVIGYHDICGAECYLSHQLARITWLPPDDLKMTDLHHDLSKLPSGHMTSAFYSIPYHQLT